MNNATDLDVTAEEQRFLRRTFHRMALPYVAVVALAFAFFALGGSEPAESESPEPLAALQAEVVALRATVDALGVEAKRAGTERSGVSKKLGAMQGRLSAGNGGDVVALERAVEGARKSIADLESRVVREATAERIAALTDRIGRIEREVATRVVAPATPEPAAPAASPEPESF